MVKLYLHKIKPLSLILVGFLLFSCSKSSNNTSTDYQYQPNKKNSDSRNLQLLKEKQEITENLILNNKHPTDELILLAESDIIKKIGSYENKLNDIIIKLKKISTALEHIEQNSHSVKEQLNLTQPDINIIDHLLKNSAKIFTENIVKEDILHIKNELNIIFTNPNVVKKIGSENANYMITGGNDLEELFEINTSLEDFLHTLN